MFRGFFDAAGTLNGLGIGNPNAEFSPNVSICRVFTEKSTARILWGFTHGEVAVTTANKVADPSRTSAAKFSRSQISEQHNGTVADGVWGESGDVLLTAGADGKVKLWDVAKMRCLWTSTTHQDVPLPASHPSHLDFDSRKGIVVAAFSSGGISIWCGLLPFYNGDGVPQVNEIVISPGSLPLPLAGISCLVLDTTNGISFLVHHLDSGYFYRHNVNPITGDVETIQFGEETDRSITSLKFVNETQMKAYPLVLVGDREGSLSVYDWSPMRVPKGGLVAPTIRIQAFGDADAVSCIEWNPWVIATGSSTGAVKVWDSLKFCLLRTFQPPTRGYTGDLSIALEREMIVIAFGDKITTWKAGSIKKGGKATQASRKGKNNALAKWRRELHNSIVPLNVVHGFTIEQVDMYRDISEFQREIEEEQTQKRGAYGREKDQLRSLEALGLNEQEALEYVLMLSRDEEERRDPSPESPTPPSFTQSRPLPSTSDVKVQTSPRAKREAWSAGIPGSPGSPEMARSMSTGSDLSDETEFPVISESVSSRGSNVSGVVATVKSQRSSGSSPNVWGTPLKVSSKPGTASPKRVTATVSMSPSTSASASGRGEREDWSSMHVESQDDRDLRLAIELSLAEATKKSET